MTSSHTQKLLPILLSACASLLIVAKPDWITCCLALNKKGIEKVFSLKPKSKIIIGDLLKEISEKIIIARVKLAFDTRF